MVPSVLFELLVTNSNNLGLPTFDKGPQIKSQGYEAELVWGRGRAVAPCFAMLQLTIGCQPSIRWFSGCLSAAAVEFSL